MDIILAIDEFRKKNAIQNSSATHYIMRRKYRKNTNSECNIAVRAEGVDKIEEIRYDIYEINGKYRKGETIWKSRRKIQLQKGLNIP